ncbi:efflux RND transporter periplasmic adaptor subunit [Candidatus Poribacteria bacterium]|nr:efflux RND transporter periplasmic adaptor subunit [Candidatus Poribacteria bacterium]
MKKNSEAIIVFAILYLALIFIFLPACGEKNIEMEQKTEVVKQADFVVKINASGNLESLIAVEVKSNVEGEIEKLLVKEGDFVEKGQLLLQIDDEQIREEMKQAEANVSAAQAQLEQSRRSLDIRIKELDNGLQQQIDTVTQAKTSYEVEKATTLQLLSQQRTEIQNSKEALEQDNISLRQAEISLKQAQLTLSEAEQAESAAKVDMDNAESELNRNKELFEKKYISKKSMEDAQAAYANAVSRYDSAQKRVLSQKETVKSQEEGINMRKKSVQMREATIKLEEENLELLKQTRAAQEEQTLTQLKNAERRLKQLQESIEDEKDISRFSLKSAEANLLRNQSNLKNANERLEWTKIIAPMSGIVINLEVEEGEIVTSGRSAFSQSPPIMEIVDLSQMVVETSINEVDMEKLKVGQKAEIRIRAYPDRIYQGEVREISPSGQPRDNIIYFQVVIAVLGSPKELRPGMTADVDIIVLEHKNALVLPIEAVKSERSFGRGSGTSPGGQSRSEKYYVLLPSNGKQDESSDDDNKSENKKYIQVGGQNDMFVEILDGLNEGDKVLVQLPQIPEEGMNRRRR